MATNMINHPIVRTDNMAGTDVRANVVSVKMSFSIDVPVENGTLLILDPPNAYYGDVHQVTSCKTDAVADGQLVLIASPEIMYEDGTDLGDFTNEVGAIMRGYVLHPGDEFGIAPVGEVTAKVGDYAHSPAGVNAAYTYNTIEEGAFGRVIAVEQGGNYTYVVIRVL